MGTVARGGSVRRRVRSMYRACTEHVWSKYRVGMMQVLITIIQYHENIINDNL